MTDKQPAAWPAVTVSGTTDTFNTKDSGSVSALRPAPGAWVPAEHLAEANRQITAMAERDRALREVGGSDAKAIAAAALQAACETDPADDDHPDTIKITTGDFEAIVRNAIEGYFETSAILASTGDADNG